ncbi:MAG: hypothetical protein ACRDP1_02460 [Nocardioidaceae bacterium]
MAASRTKETPETPEASQRAAESPEDRDARVEAAKADTDVVAVESIDKNGNPDQAEGYKVLGRDVPVEGVNDHDTK